MTEISFCARYRADVFSNICKISLTLSGRFVSLGSKNSGRTIIPDDLLKNELN